MGGRGIGEGVMACPRCPEGQSYVTPGRSGSCTSSCVVIIRWLELLLNRLIVQPRTGLSDLTPVCPT